MHYLMPVLAVVVSVLSNGSACADFGDQLFKLLPKDGAASDNFGSSVAISGTTIVIGASHNGNGSAYIFSAATGQQLFKLLPNDGAEWKRYGFSVGNIVSPAMQVAIVGAPWDNDNGANSGSAYLFDTTTGAQIFKLLPNDGAEGFLFGISVAISGTVAIVGAIGSNENGDYSGSAYIFDISDPSKPTQVIKLLPKDGAAHDLFGSSVSINSNIVIVGAFGDDGDNGQDFGSAYLFETSTGNQIAKLMADDGSQYEHFGYSVAIGGSAGNEIAIVGILIDDNPEPGCAYLFDANTGQQLFKLIPDDGAATDQFGRSVSISGNTAVIGAHRDGENGIDSGSVYIFDISNPAIPTQIAKILPNDGTAGDRFGTSVAISESSAIVGASGDDDACPAEPFCNSGSAYIFDASTSPGSCPWDLDKSGDVSTTDLLELFAQWGTDGSADFDGSGAVGTIDLLILFANWGPCP